jgi:periplasmic divalent cation tolerance protein
MEDGAIVVLCTAPDQEQGAKLARGLVENKLAACVNVLPGLRSFFTWQGNVEDDAEVQLFIKTRKARFDEVQRWLNENHPYDVPEMLALPVEAGNKEYVDWLHEETSS